MGCVNCSESCRTITRKQILKTLNEKQKNYRPEFKTYAQFHKTIEKRKSVLLSKCSTFNNTVNQPSSKLSQSSFRELQLQSESQLEKNELDYTKTIVLLAKVPSKKVQKQNDVLFVDGRLIFLTEAPLPEPEQDSAYLLKILKANNVSLAEYLSGDRDKILEGIKWKQEKMDVQRRQKITNEYFDQEFRELIITREATRE